MAITTLCTLAQVKAWLAIPDANTASDAVLTAVLTAASQAIIGALNRQIFPGTHSEMRDGTGKARMQLTEWPVRAITALSLDGTAVQANTQSPPLGTGYTLAVGDPGPPGRPQMLYLQGGLYFPSGSINVNVTYTFGYVDTLAQAIPATPYVVAAPVSQWGNWNSDQGVAFADGTPLIPVASAPAHGQYVVTAAGQYTFAAADTGLAIVITYGYTPAALAQACLQTVGEWFKAKDRIGVSSKGLAGQEQITYSQKELSNTTKLMMAPYVRVVQP